MSAAASAPRAVHLTFEAAGDWCFGWYHPPAQPWRDMVVVLCPPLGHEAVCSYPTQVQMARGLADAGFPVLRFDYPGTGDSGGDANAPGAVQAWVDSVGHAIAHARERSNARSVALLGIRLGATLAIEAAARQAGVDSLLLWAPCPSGKAFLRELRAGGVQGDDGVLHSMGERYSPSLATELQALDATRAGPAPARRALVIGRDDLPAEGPLPRALRARSMDIEFRVLPGYAAMVDEPRAGVLDEATLRSVIDWLAASPAAAPRSERPPEAVETLQWRRCGAVRETAMRCGPDGSLVGVLTEPTAGAACDRTGRTGVLLLNVGANYRVGPHHVYVAMARTLAAAGHRVLRFDIAGVGDSPPKAGEPWANLYMRESAQDVRAAIDALALRGSREFVLMGICSGSYLSFQGALADERVDGVVMMNTRLLEWTPGKPGDSWQTSMQQYAKSSDYYRRALFTADAWRKLLRGQVHVQLIARRMLALGAARVKRALTFRSREESVLRKMKRLCERGTDVLMLVSDSDDGRDYVEFHFGPAGQRMRMHPNFRMAYVPAADHTFSKPGNREHVLPELLRHLAQRPPASRLAAAAASEQPPTVLEEAAPSASL